MAPMADKKKKKKPASLGCVFWIAFILLIIILFFFNKKNIGNILEKTGAVDLFSGKKPVAEKTADDTKDKVPALNTDDAIPAANNSDNGKPAPSGDGSKEPEKQDAVKAPASTSPKADAKPAAVTQTKADNTPDKAPEKAPSKAPDKTPPKVTTPAKPVAVKPQAEKAAQTRKSSLFFVVIDAEGRVVRKEVTRDIPMSDSPLTDALNALLKGPTQVEASKGYRSLVPAGTKILSVIVKNGVATINLSDEFQFNQYGIEGYLGQLSEIVFTATAFSTVTSVQFLIEGQRREYLGAEGVWIGTPLSRDKFQ